MAQYSVWVHGNVARAQWVADLATRPVEAIRADGATGPIPWTDIVGLPQGSGMTFRGRGRPAVAPPAAAATISTQPAAQPVSPPIYFHFPLPTPVAVGATRAKLLRVFVLWKAENAMLQEVNVFDGPTSVASIKSTVTSGFDGSTVTNLDTDLVEGTTRFTIKDAHPMVFGLGISVGFGFGKDGQITFTAAGADFEI